MLSLLHQRFLNLVQESPKTFHKILFKIISYSTLGLSSCHFALVSFPLLLSLCGWVLLLNWSLFKLCTLPLHISSELETAINFTNYNMVEKKVPGLFTIFIEKDFNMGIKTSTFKWSLEWTNIISRQFMKKRFPLWTR